MLTDNVLVKAVQIKTRYFGHPLAGFFLTSDRLTASCQMPLILTNSGFGPGVLFVLVFFIEFLPRR